MSASAEVALAIWLNINVLFVVWRTYRAIEKGELCLATSGS